MLPKHTYLPATSTCTAPLRGRSCQYPSVTCVFSSCGWSWRDWQRRVGRVGRVS